MNTGPLGLWALGHKVSNGRTGKDLFLRFLLQTGCVEGGEHVEKITLVKPLLGTSLVGPMANTLVLPMLGPRFDPWSGIQIPMP